MQFKAAYFSTATRPFFYGDSVPLPQHRRSPAPNTLFFKGTRLS